MKIKTIILMILCMLFCGCSTTSNQTIADAINKLESHNKTNNIYRAGYKYYLPFNMNVDEYYLYNEVISNESNIFYLYVDLISYYNKTNNTYEENKDAYYSELINFKDKTGYIEINLKENNQYLIEIVFNYAKIEVMVDEDALISSIDSAVAILQSIEYNDNIIANLIDENILSYQEEEYDIFNANREDSNYLKLVEADEEENTDNDIKDTDLLN